jgi:hypothetical protein
MEDKLEMEDNRHEGKCTQVPTLDRAPAGSFVVRAGRVARVQHACAQCLSGISLDL